MTKRMLTYTLLLLLLVTEVTSSFGNAFASASTEFYPYDAVNVFDDLATSSVDGNAFNFAELPYDASGTPRIITLVEWCYSYDATRQDDFALYVYIYNPAKLDFVADPERNKIQLSTKQVYNDDIDELEATDYHKYSLAFCNMSTHPSYAGLYYKYRVVDEELADGKTIVQRVNSNARRYDISGVELLTRGDTNATEYAVGGTYTYSGYATGYGPEVNAESNLTCEVSELETVRLDVRNTFFRTASSSKGADYQNQLDSVYFAVPNELLNKYGKLQRVKAEWYEYKTKEIVVTSNTEFYNKAKSRVGVTLADADYTLGYYLASNYRYDLLQQDYIATWAWNFPQSWRYQAQSYASAIYYLLPSSGDIAKYDPYGATAQGGVSSNDLANYIYNYPLGTNVLDTRYANISADLFMQSVDTNHTRGYNVRDFDADVDMHELLTYNNTKPSFWHKIEEYGWWNTVFGNIPNDTSFTNIPPIYAVSDLDFKDDVNDSANALLVRADDIVDLYNYAEQARNNNQTTFLFRYSTTDYLSRWLTIYEAGDAWGFFDTKINGQAYYAQQSVFLDFDIIQLTFSRDGRLRVIPVVASPLDVINSITPPTTSPNPAEDFFAELLQAISEGWANFWAGLWDWIVGLFTAQLPWWAWLVIALVGLIICGILIGYINNAIIAVKAVFRAIYAGLRYICIGIYNALKYTVLGLYYVVSFVPRMIYRAFAR